MNKNFNFRGEEDIAISRGHNRVRLHLTATSLGVTGEQKAELEAMFDDLCATINEYIDSNAETIGNIFPETTED